MTAAEARAALGLRPLRTAPLVTVVPEPVELTDEERYEEYMERQARGAHRDRRASGWAKGQPRCGVCKLFISTPSSPCSCGFDNGLGRYASAA
jgi:hypothetical protein